VSERDQFVAPLSKSETPEATDLPCCPSAVPFIPSGISIPPKPNPSRGCRDVIQGGSNGDPDVPMRGAGGIERE
jgi:hypothetical protein